MKDLNLQTGRAVNPSKPRLLHYNPDGSVTVRLKCKGCGKLAEVETDPRMIYLVKFCTVGCRIESKNKQQRLNPQPTESGLSWLDFLNATTYTPKGFVFADLKDSSPILRKARIYLGG